MFLLNINFLYALWYLRYSPDKILKINVTTERSKVKSQSHYDVLHTYTPNQCPYQVSKLRFLRYREDKIIKLKVDYGKTKG